MSVQSLGQHLCQLLETLTEHLRKSDPQKAAVVAAELASLIKKAEANNERLDSKSLTQARSLCQLCSEAMEACHTGLIGKLEQIMISSRASFVYNRSSLAKYK